MHHLHHRLASITMSAENVFDRQGVAFVVDLKPVWKAMKMDRRFNLFLDPNTTAIEHVH